MIEPGGDNINASLTRVLTKGILAAALTTDQILEAATLRLYKDGPAPLNSDMTLGDFDLCDFSGYAQVTPVAFSAPTFEDGSATVVSLDAANVFNGTDGTTVNTVQGWMLTDGTTSTANILYAEPLDTPIEMGAADSQLVLIPRIKIPTTVS